MNSYWLIDATQHVGIYVYTERQVSGECLNAVVLILISNWISKSDEVYA